jgi:subtilisin family serine protease
MLAVCVAIATPAMAQEAINTPSATQPAKGVAALRLQTRVFRLGNDPTGLDRDATVLSQSATLTYGLSRNASISLRMPIALRHEVDAGELDREFGFEDASIEAKYRVWQRDTGAINFQRIALVVGSELPTGTGDLSSHSFDPYVGAVFTGVWGRHGINQSVRYKFNTGTDEYPLLPGQGEDDALYLDTAYLYRFSPDVYRAGTEASFYGVVELNTLYETGGDWETLLSPGVLYEARRFAVEAGVQVPVFERVETHPEVEWGFVIGFRVLF